MAFNFALLGLLPFHAIAEGNVKLTRIEGGVMIDAAGQFKPVTLETFVDADTKILMQKSSSAQLIYPNGCAVTLQANNIYKAGDENNCKQGTAILVGVNDTAAVGGTSTVSSAAGGDNNTAFLILGVGALGIGAAIAGSGGGSQSPTPSP